MGVLVIEGCITHPITGSVLYRADVAEDEDEVRVTGSLNWNFCSLADLLCGVYNYYYSKLFYIYSMK